MLATSALATTISLSLFTLAQAQVDPQLVGTWTTKSRTVVTGPAFYDPVNDKLLEPKLPGISYSFTADGHYEEAYFRAVSNPTSPNCPSGVLQWQHGTFVKDTNGSLILKPIAVDGRELTSEPCSLANAVVLRYNNPELFQRYETVIDKYQNIRRLNLYRFDGSPLPPMYLAYSPPQMLPVQTLNPTTSATAAASTPTPGTKLRRDFKSSKEFILAAGLAQQLPNDHDHALTMPPRTAASMWASLDADWVWWIGVAMTALGGLGYFLM